MYDLCLAKSRFTDNRVLALDYIEQEGELSIDRDILKLYQN